MQKALLPKILFIGILLCSCKGKVPKQWEAPESNNRLDYSNIDLWAAHPSKPDSSDLIPKPLQAEDLNDFADVFFVYPTIYWQKRSDDLWNAPIDDEKLNERIESASMKNQASIFNAVGDIYAPRYRQAHIGAYFSDNPPASTKAFELAYKDVKEAFLYYMEHHNKGKPFVIASHSQGTTHCMRLIRELIDGTDLEDQMVAAYLVGIGVPAFYYKSLKPCSYPTEVSCICSWRTFEEGHYPDNHFSYLTEYINTNPITWTDEDASKDQHLGAVLLDFDLLEPGICEAKKQEGLIWMKKPAFKGSKFFFRKNYHVGDYNLFYLDVRKNAVNRARAWIEKHTEMR
ncbi:MAG: DUF3089 domain-containing protein [Saprospiraceae bacterium]|nr:DUF3089 domain-containing protein [Saprospiraceae bacterium]